MRSDPHTLSPAGEAACTVDPRERMSLQTRARLLLNRIEKFLPPYMYPAYESWLHEHLTHSLRMDWHEAVRQSAAEEVRPVVDALIHAIELVTVTTDVAVARATAIRILRPALITPSVRREEENGDA